MLDIMGYIIGPAFPISKKLFYLWGNWGGQLEISGRGVMESTELSGRKENMNRHKVLTLWNGEQLNEVDTRILWNRFWPEILRAPISFVKMGTPSFGIEGWPGVKSAASMKNYQWNVSGRSVGVFDFMGKNLWPGLDRANRVFLLR